MRVISLLILCVFFKLFYKQNNSSLPEYLSIWVIFPYFRLNLMARIGSQIDNIKVHMPKTHYSELLNSVNKVTQLWYKIPNG